MKSLKHNLFYFFGYVISRFQLLLILPLVTHKIPQRDYGAFEALTSFGLLLSAICIFCQDNCLPSHFNPEDETENKISPLVMSSFSVSAVVTALVLVISLVFKYDLAYFITGQKGFENDFLIYAITAALTGFITMNNVLLRLRFKSFLTAVNLVSNTFFTLAFSYYFIVVLNAGLRGLILGLLCSQSLSSLISLFMNRKFYRYLPRPHMVLDLAKMAVPLIPFSLVAWILNFSDRVLIANMRGLQELSIYAMALRAGSLAGALFGPFQLAWLPMALQSQRSELAEKEFPMYFNFFHIFAGTIILGLTMISPFVISLLSTAEYAVAKNYVGILVLSNYLYMAYYFPMSTFIFHKKNVFCTYAFMVGAAVNLSINLLFIKRFGLDAVMAANVTGYFFILILSLSFEKNLDRVRYSKNYLIPSFLLLLITTLSIEFLRPTPSVQALISLVALVIFLGFSFIANRVSILDVLRRKT